MNVPSLEELLIQLKKPTSHKRSLRELYRRIASGQVEPELKGNNAVLAAQAMVILFQHAEPRTHQQIRDSLEELES